MYEALRTTALYGGGIRSGLTAVIYHGMLHGLMLIATESAPIQQRPAIHTPTLPSLTIDKALVRQLANMVLQSQAEVMHVY